jgi:hypothetical protein
MAVMIVIVLVVLIFALEIIRAFLGLLKFKVAVRVAKNEQVKMLNTILKRFINN